MIGAIFLVALTGQAEAPAPPEPPVVVEGQRHPEEKKQCRMQRETGTRVVKMVCRSIAEQRQINQQARNAIRLGNRSGEAPDAFVPPTSE